LAQDPSSCYCCVRAAMEDTSPCDAYSPITVPLSPMHVQFLGSSVDGFGPTLSTSPECAPSSFNSSDSSQTRPSSSEPIMMDDLALVQVDGWNPWTIRGMTPDAAFRLATLKCPWNEAAYPYFEFPSLGSVAHIEGRCKPCAFMYEGCVNGVACQFCHLCPPGELKRRKRKKQAQFRKRAL